MTGLRKLTLLFLPILLFISGCKSGENNPVESTGNENVFIQYGTPFQAVPETKDIVMYEINQRAFSASGDFRGIINRLDSIKALGINVIWLMPVFPIGELKSAGEMGSPYSVRNYREVNPEFGNLADLRELVTKAHDRGMAVILDWVANHTAWDNPWISNKDWYTQDGAGNIIHPQGTNWLDVADLNYSNAEMRKAMINAMKYWVYEANIDGFRCDVADMVPADFWKQVRDSLAGIPGRKLIMLAEGSRWDHFTSGFQLNYAWDFYGKLKDVFRAGQSAANLKSVNISEYDFMPAGLHKLRFTTNHDESAWDDSPVNLFGGLRGSMAAFVTAIFMRGVPLVYAGQETGRSAKTPFFSRSPIDWNANPEIVNEYRQLLNVRSSNEVFKQGSVEYMLTSDVVCFTRKSGNQEALVIVNVRNRAVGFTLNQSLQNTLWKNLLTGADYSAGTQISLGNYEYLILLRTV
ncbi:MAG: alpha-glucosidase C-terminal domain-containing protein [Ignavibacteriaceae bacterium]|nr:alpha-glucosidase C-terminal domain-containing protein [Ignavibacteriaceae bacterium]